MTDGSGAPASQSSIAPALSPKLPVSIHEILMLRKSESAQASKLADCEVYF